MRYTPPATSLASLLAQYDDIGGCLDFVFIESHDVFPPELLHRSAVLAGIKEIDANLDWDASKLTGERITFSAFWGSDDVEPKPIGPNAYWLPKVDGYKTAFFLPPHGLGGPMDTQMGIFMSINKHVLGIEPQRAEIFSWSTDWSSYFEAGLEFWGAFMWTIRPIDTDRIVVVGASCTD